MHQPVPPMIAGYQNQLKPHKFVVAAANFALDDYRMQVIAVGEHNLSAAADDAHSVAGQCTLGISALVVWFFPA